MMHPNTPTPNANHVYLVYDKVIKAYVYSGLSWYDAAYYIWEVSKTNAEQDSRYELYERVVTKPGTKMKARLYKEES